MNFLRRMAVLLSGWIDDVSLAVISISGVIRPVRKFQLVEQENLAFNVEPTRGRSAHRAIGAQLRFVEGRIAKDFRRGSWFATCGRANRTYPRQAPFCVPSLGAAATGR